MADDRNGGDGDRLDSTLAQKSAQTESKIDLDEDALRRLESLRRHSRFIEEMFAMGWTVDLAEEPPEIQKGLKYIETNILKGDKVDDSALDTMLDAPEAPITQVVAACEKLQFLEILEILEIKLEGKILNSKDRQKRIQWLGYMPDSAGLLNLTIQEYKKLGMAKLIQMLSSYENELEVAVIGFAIEKCYAKRTVLCSLEKLDNPSLPQGPRVALRDRLVADLESIELKDRHADWFKRIWAYAARKDDHKLKTACADALTRASDPAFHEKLPDLWDGRFPPHPLFQLAAQSAQSHPSTW